MTQDKPYRSVALVALVVLAAVVGGIATAGTVAAQDGDNATNDSASEEEFYNPSDGEPLNVRFRDGAANTVESIAEGVLNLNIVYGLFDGPYDVEISAPGLSDEQIEEATFDESGYDTQDLDRTDIVGMDITGLPAGNYEFTVSVADGEAEQTVPLEVTGDDGAVANESADGANETTETANESADGANASANETTTNATNETTANASANETANATTANATGETEIGTATAAGTDANTTITAVPSAPNTSANHTVSTVVGADAAGNLSELTIDYGESNASIGLVGGSITTATLGGQSVVNNTTAPTIGAQGQNLTIGFDGTVDASEGDRLNVTFGGVTNPPEAGDYTVGVAVNNGSSQNTTLTIGENATAGAATETEMGSGSAAATNGNASITADPSAAGNESTNHTASIVAGPNATGNLSELTIDYGESNASIGLVGGSISTATLGGQSIVNNTTAPTIGAQGQNLTIGFDGTISVSEGDRLNMTYGGVTNPPEAGNYTVSMTLNNGSVRNATLEITESTASATTAGGGADTAATDGGATTATGDETAAGTADETGGGQATEAGGPGFGIAVAIVALLGAALLATRRS
ncbi:beta strand repeat-containing protein [Halococcus qingdaonensis]|uniref:beta strand repeat-containing protein n=1 Tax=Halococcus qingdaonensis TaxID=224402 RepID=UPI0021169C76|nr:PGF-CTERM sorting domain-containing protein [Halococcus qingdaonensis]